MRRLNQPAYPARTTFELCISRVRDEVLKARLEAVTQSVVEASDQFDAAARRHALHEIPSQAMVGGQVAAAEMESVYTHRMAKKGAPGRSVYEAIIRAAKGRCPLCAQRQVTTLDHHLPKSRYPALAVTPLNLVPACTDCNRAKLASVPRSAEEVALHPYYDDIDGQRWLAATVVETRPAAVRFHIEAPVEWNDILEARVRNHFSTLGLGVLYASHAADELANVRHQLEQLLASVGAQAVRSELARRAESCELADRNGWRAATYRAWAGSQWFCNGGFEPQG